MSGERARRIGIALGGALLLAGAIWMPPAASSSGSARVEIGPIYASGAHSESTLRLALRRQQAALRACYHRVLQRSPEARGNIELSLTIGGTAARWRSVTPSVSVVRASLPDRELLRCLVWAIRSATLSPSLKATTAHVHLSLVPAAAPSRQHRLPATVLGPAAPQPGPPRPAPPTRKHLSFVSGQIIDSVTSGPVIGATLLLVKPGASIGDLRPENVGQMTAASAVSIELGFFITRSRVPRGRSYGIVVLARGYEPWARDAAIQLRADASPYYDIGRISLRRKRY